MLTSVTPTPFWHRFVIAFRSLVGLVKPDWISALQRKVLQSWRTKFRKALSLVRFVDEKRGIAAVSRTFLSNIEEFLCTPDCVAERSGLELSVHFPEAKASPTEFR